MTQSKKIAVTGGIGSGKSAVLSLLAKKGFCVFSCDEIYRELWEEQAFSQALGALFPTCVREGRPDRTLLAELVFSDEQARKTLNEFTHPRIMERLFARMAEHPLSFAEVPLLFEEGYAGCFDRVIVVLRDREQRIEALKVRSGYTREQALRRMTRQYNYDAPLPSGCDALHNNGSLAALEQELDALLHRLLIT